MLGPFPVNASALVTITAWVKKDHATNVAAKLYVEDALYNLDGVVAAECLGAQVALGFGLGDGAPKSLFRKVQLVANVDVCDMRADGVAARCFGIAECGPALPCTQTLLGKGRGGDQR